MHSHKLQFEARKCKDKLAFSHNKITMTLHKKKTMGTEGICSNIIKRAVAGTSLVEREKTKRRLRQSHQEMKRFPWKSKTVIHPLVYIPSHFSLPSLLFLAMSFTLFHTFSNYIICFADKSTSHVLFLMMSLSFLTLTLFNQMRGNRINRKSIAKGTT